MHGEAWSRRRRREEAEKGKEEGGARGGERRTGVHGPTPTPTPPPTPYTASALPAQPATSGGCPPLFPLHPDFLGRCREAGHLGLERYKGTPGAASTSGGGAGGGAGF